MKKILILTAILFAMISCSSEQPYTNIYHEVERTNDVYNVNGECCLRTVVIDSCEYLIGRKCRGYYGYGFLSHKGNCKYCAERRKRELQNLK